MFWIQERFLSDSPASVERCCSSFSKVKHFGFGQTEKRAEVWNITVNIASAKARRAIPTLLKGME